MGLTQLKACCSDAQEENQQGNLLTMLQNDYRNFEKERWYMFQNPMLFDANKFIFLYPNYEEDQSILLNRWRSTIDIKNVQFGESRFDEDVMSTRWKYAIKRYQCTLSRGVPIEYYKTMISLIFNKNYIATITTTKLAYDRIKIQTNFNEIVPLFGLQGPNMKQAINAPHLNEKGVAALKELLHAFKRKKGENFYNRYFSHMTALLLIFFEDHQVYDLVVTMMELSSNMTSIRLQSLRWHLLFREEQQKWLAENFFKTFKSNSESVAKLEKHFDKNKIDKIELFNKITENFFYTFLPFPFILTILIIYLNEGVKIFLRIFYGIIIYSENQLYQSTTLQRCLLALKKKCLHLNSAESKIILKNSYNLRFKATVSTRLIESRLKKEQSERKYYFLPFIKGTSEILTFDDLEVIWNFLPFQLKTYDIEVTYPNQIISETSKLSLRKLIKSLEHSMYNLIIVQTQQNFVFGCLLIGRIHDQQTKQWHGNPQNFVFTLSNRNKKYSMTRENNNFLYTGDTFVKIGDGPEGPALKLDEKLMTGESFKSHTYRNEPLHNGTVGQFKIKAIEAFALF